MLLRMSSPLIIPIFIPHSGCPHHCAFCNQSIVTGQSSPLPDKSSVRRTIEQYLAYKWTRPAVEVAFFGGNFFGLAPKDIVGLLDMLDPYIQDKTVDGIRCSTRPDTVNRATLDAVSGFKLSTVELGVQSMDDTVLKKSRRGHTAQDTIQAIHLLKQYGLRIGVQMMLGLPLDSESSLMESTRQIADLNPDFARIYPLVVLKGSLLAQWYHKGEYTPLSLVESVRLAKQMVEIFSGADIPVIRLGLQASDMMDDGSNVIAGPWHPAFGHLVHASLLYDNACGLIDQGPDVLKKGEIILAIHPVSESRLRGDKNNNLEKLHHRYPGTGFSIQQDNSLQPGKIEIRTAKEGLN